MAKKITRRTFVGTSIHLAVVAPVIHLEPIEAAQPSAGFPAVERRMLRAAIDVIIPAEGRMPAATAVGGLDYVERMAAADGKLRELLIAGLRALDSHLRTTSGLAFVDSRPAQQTAAITHAEKTDSPPGFFGALRDAVFEAYYTQPEIWKQLGYTFRRSNRRTAAVEPFDERRVGRLREMPPFYRPIS
jgi:gluconate 2-dehydrogenase subunit 3-like protein